MLENIIDWVPVGMIKLMGTEYWLQTTQWTCIYLMKISSLFYYYLKIISKSLYPHIQIISTATNSINVIKNRLINSLLHHTLRKKLMLVTEYFIQYKNTEFPSIIKSIREAPNLNKYHLQQI